MYLDALIGFKQEDEKIKIGYNITYNRLIILVAGTGLEPASASGGYEPVLEITR